MKITRQNFFPHGVALPPKKLLPAFEVMLAYLKSGKFVDYMCVAIAIVYPELKHEFEDYVTNQYLRPNVETNNFYNFYRRLKLDETGNEPHDVTNKQATKLRIQWLEAAIANIKKRSAPRAMKLSDTSVYKRLKKGLADDPSEFQKVYKGLKWAWDTYEDRNPRFKREEMFNKTLSHIAYWGDMPVEDWDYWRDLCNNFFPEWNN